MRLTGNFTLQELVHPTIYNKIGDRSADFLHPKLAINCQSIKDFISAHLGYIEPVTINDWSWGGGFRSSGLRLPAGIVGAKLSSHRFGCSVDLKFKTITPVEVQSLIMANQADFPYISRMENAKITKTWLHVESTEKRSGDIIIYNP